MQYTISEARQQDLPAIVEIYNSTVATRQSTADLSPVSVAERQVWFDAHGG
ncbi:Putative phosphinothricin acetyltransferase YwnH [Bergeriella denitrificans]|uniref:Phosphinothricin acetyltransferase YwnH n=1 Tax=Bergeriella denitrificans TaxID=494 RepID=A0A378UDJ2_BERDE|nr:Putative phosphinothricin acetyltransferase YwnH [Bergeriella denitrificans]